MWQAPEETVEVLLRRYPEGAAVRNQYGSLPLHLAASNQATPKVIRLLVAAYPDALHLQNDDGMTPLDLAVADQDGSVGGISGASVDPAVVAILEGRPIPPEQTRRQQAEKYEERAMALERKIASLRGSENKQDNDMKLALAAVRRLADRFPHSLYAAGMDPNQLEIAFSDQLADGRSNDPLDSERILLEAIRKRNMGMGGGASTAPSRRGHQGHAGSPGSPSGHSPTDGPRDRVEDLLSSIVGLEHIKSQIRGLRRTAEITDLRESLLPMTGAGGRGGGGMGSSPRSAGSVTAGPLSLLSPALAEDVGRTGACHMVFAGNPGTGKTAVARLLAKALHELGLLRKPKFLAVERMDLTGRDRETTIVKTREVLDEARGGVMFIDEAYNLGMSSKTKQRNRTDTGPDAMQEIIRCIGQSMTSPDDTFPLIILAGFPLETQAFLAFNPDLRKHFPLVFELLDYTCDELAHIFIDLAASKGFEFDGSITDQTVARLLETETTHNWRSERNGRVSEMLLNGVRTEIRKRMRRAQMAEEDDFDPQVIIRSDIESVIRTDFK
jgi:ATPase family associated with various cellular activities (AAA)